MSSPTLTGSRHDAWAAFSVSTALIVFSFLLTPSPKGFGTHQQLLLPPCFLRLVTKVPCPFCGMTTGFAWMARGHVHAATSANLMAAPAFLVTAVFALLGLYGVVSGRPWLPEVLRRPAFPRALLVVILGFWLVNIAIAFGWWHV